MEDKKKVNEDIVQLARLGLTGRDQDVQRYVRRIIRRMSALDPVLTDALAELLAHSPSKNAPLRDAGAEMTPVDADSRMRLLRHEFPVIIDCEPILNASLRAALEQVVAERNMSAHLARRDLTPTKSMLFVGPPGVGKTLCARWIAAELNRPLLILDLSTVMSSFLGKTGTNLRNVLDHAKSVDSVLLLDEFDAVAKRRDDETEIGELKRLVTVLLQEIDDWPSTGLLIAATNHPELLDPAAWRRFDHVFEFALPDSSELEEAIIDSFALDLDAAAPWVKALSAVWSGRSFSDAARSVMQIRRQAAIQNRSVSDAISELSELNVRGRKIAERKAVAQALLKSELSDHKINQLTGVARETLRKMRHTMERGSHGRKLEGASDG